MKIYEKIAKVVSTIIAVCCMIAIWHLAEIPKHAERYPVKEEEYVSLADYALETAKNLNEEDTNISTEEIVRRKNDNYKVDEIRYANDIFYVKVSSNVAKVEAAIPAAVIGIEREANIIDFKMSLKYDEATYTREATVCHWIQYSIIVVCMAVLIGIIVFYSLDAVGLVVTSIILLIKWIIKKVKKQ